MAITDAQAADIAGVPADFVKKVRRKMQKCNSAVNCTEFYVVTYPLLG